MSLRITSPLRDVEKNPHTKISTFYSKILQRLSLSNLMAIPLSLSIGSTTETRYLCKPISLFFYPKQKVPSRLKTQAF